MDVSTQTLPERAWVEVHLAGLVANARAVRDAARGGSLVPMVKANAYGLGAIACARALLAVEPWGFGVATVEEGIELREAGIDLPVLVFTPATVAQRARYEAHDLRAVLEDDATAASWGLPFHLEIDTGMGRAGVRWDDRARLARFARLRPEGVFTHLHSADTDQASVAEQCARFAAARGELPTESPLVHIANSAGVFRSGRDGLALPTDLVRPGIFLYGGSPGPELPRPRQVAALRARVVSTRDLRAGDTVSYGADWRAPQATRAVTLAIGYADGVPRAVQGNAWVLLRGCRCPVIGRVTMDMTVVDVSTLPGPPPSPGEIATLIGSDGPEEITLDRFAGWARTISYEILTGLGARLPRVYRPAAP